MKKCAAPAIQVRLLLILVAALAMLIGLIGATHRPLRAQTATPTPAPLAQWISSAPAAVASELPASAQYFGLDTRMGEQPQDLCGRVASKQSVWALSTTEIDVHNGPLRTVANTYLVDGKLRTVQNIQLFYVQLCGAQPHPATRVRLRTPAGDQIELVKQTLTSNAENSTETASAQTYYYHIFGYEDAEGSYTLQVQSPAGSVRRLIQVQRFDYLTDLYTGPRFYLRNGKTAADRSQFVPGTATTALTTIRATIRPRN